MAESLKQKAVKGLIWSGIERLSGQIVTFVLTLILARLVTPHDYGVLAIVMVFVSISSLIVDAGFANALIRKVDCTDEDRSTVLYFNIATSIILYGILYLFTPNIASFYNNIDLIPLIRSATTVIIINSFSIVQQAILTAQIDFKKQTKISLSSSIISGLVGIWLAYQGYGVWALVMQTIILASIRVIMLWLVVRWRPLIVFSSNSFKDLFGYSYKLMLSNLIVKGGNETLQLLMGFFFSTANLGYYNYSKRMADFPSTNITTTIQRVLFPVFSKIQTNDHQLAENFRQSLVLGMTAIFPIMFGISVLAEPLVNILLTSEWKPVIPILSITAITMGVWPLLLFNMNILWVKKRSDLSLILEIVAMVVKLAVVLYLFRFGLLYVCMGFAVVTVINFITYAYVTSRLISYNYITQILDICKVLFKSALASFATFYLVIPNIDNNVLQLLFGFISIVVITSFLTILCKGYEYKLIVKVIKDKYKN